MREDSLALSTVPPPVPEETDYDAIYAAVMQTERGRWFLEEYAKRNRNADTRLVLAAFERLETAIRSEHARAANEGLRSDLMDIAKAFALPRPGEAEPVTATDSTADEPDADAGCAVLAAATRLQDIARAMGERGLDPKTCGEIDALAVTILSASALHDPSDPRTKKLAEVLAQLERRIGAMIDAAVAAPDRETGPPAHEPPGEASPAETVAEVQAIDVPPTREPEAPPSPVAPAAIPDAPPDPPRAADADATAQIDDELFATLPVPGGARAAAPEMPAQRHAPASMTETAGPAAVTATPSPAVEPAAPAVPMPQPRPRFEASDPLAALKAMSDEERIALFT